MCRELQTAYREHSPPVPLLVLWVAMVAGIVPAMLVGLTLDASPLLAGLVGLVCGGLVYMALRRFYR